MSDNTMFVNGVGICDVSPPVLDTCTKTCFALVTSVIYTLGPSVRTRDFGKPSCVIWMVLTILGEGIGQFSHVSVTPTATTLIAAATHHFRRNLLAAGGVRSVAATFPEVESLFKRFRSPLSSAAFW